MTQWLRDFGAILKVVGGMLFGAGLCILIGDAFLTLPVILTANAFTLIMIGVFMLMGGFGIEAIFGE